MAKVDKRVASARIMQREQPPHTPRLLGQNEVVLFTTIAVWHVASHRGRKRRGGGDTLPWQSQRVVPQPLVFPGATFCVLVYASDAKDAVVIVLSCPLMRACLPLLFPLLCPCLPFSRYKKLHF